MFNLYSEGTAGVLNNFSDQENVSTVTYEKNENILSFNESKLYSKRQFSHPLCGHISLYEFSNIISK